MSVRQRVHRILRKLRTFQSTDQVPDWMAGLDPDDRMLGLYSGDDLDIVITEKTVWLHTPEGVRRLDFAAIDQIEIAEPKTPTVFLIAHRKDGEAWPLVGFKHHGRFCDAYEFWRFLTRSVEDVQKGR